jgi:hypothetical protein
VDRSGPVQHRLAGDRPHLLDHRCPKRPRTDSPRHRSSRPSPSAEEASDLTTISAADGVIRTHEHYSTLPGTPRKMISPDAVLASSRLRVFASSRLYTSEGLEERRRIEGCNCPRSSNINLCILQTFRRSDVQTFRRSDVQTFRRSDVIANQKVPSPEYRASLCEQLSVPPFLPYVAAQEQIAPQQRSGTQTAFSGKRRVR